MKRRVNLNNIKISEKDQELILKFDSFIHTYFPSLPLDEFELIDEVSYNSLNTHVKNGTLKSYHLKTIVNKMITHLKQKNNQYATIEVHLVEPKDQLTRRAGDINSNNKIRIFYEKRMTAMNVLFIIAHELAHSYQFHEPIKFIGSNEDYEKFTDCLTIYLGFGQYALLGKSFSYTVKNIYYPKDIGYLDLSQLAFAQKLIRKQKKNKTTSKKASVSIKKQKSKAKQLISLIHTYEYGIDNMLSSLSTCSKITKRDFNKISKILLEINNHRLSNINTISDKIDKSSSTKIINEKYKIITYHIEWWLVTSKCISELFNKYCK